MVDTVGRGGAGGRVSVPSLGGRRPPAKRKRPQKERRKKPRPTKTAKPESKMESRKKDKPVKPSEYIRRVISGPEDRRASNRTQLESMGSVKGGTRKDLQEFNSAIKQTETIQKGNVVALRKLKNLKTVVIDGLEKSTRKGVERLIKKDITDPTRRASDRMLYSTAPGNIATRTAKKSDKKRFQKLQKRVDREEHRKLLANTYKRITRKPKKGEIP